jgi:hypothetical protein
MSTTRKLYVALQIDDGVMLEAVVPTRALIVTAMPCERQTAGIRNKTVRYMGNNDIAGVTYKYLQNKAGKENTFFEVVVWTTVVFLIVKRASEDFYGFILVAGCVANILPNVCNTLRYRETENACKDWLRNKIGESRVQEIEKIRKNHFHFNGRIRDNFLGYTKVANFLENEKLGIAYSFSRTGV